MKFIDGKGGLHFLLALFALPFILSMPEAVKLILGFYMYYLVEKRNPVYLPALMVWATPGTTISYAILISCAIVVFLNIRDIQLVYGRKLLYAVLILLPVFLGMSYVRLFEHNVGLVNTLVPLGYYLGLYPFFYGVLMARNFTYASVSGILFSLFLLPLLFKLNVYSDSVRLFWLSYPLFLTVFILGLFKLRLIRKKYFFLFLCSIIFLIMFPVPKFTLLFSAVVGIGIFFYKRLKLLKVFGDFTWNKVVLIFLAIVVYFIKFGSEKADDYKNVSLGESTYYSSFDDFTSKLAFKAFGDRSVIWIGGWEAIRDAGAVMLPPYEVTAFEYTSAKGRIHDDVSFGVHNLGLELMRNYGIVFGAIIMVIYLIMITVGPLRFISKDKNFILNMLALSCFGSGMVGALVGQYPLMVTFSIGLLAISGMLYGLVEEYA